MNKNPKNPKVDAYVKHAKKWRPEIEKLREIALNCGLTEELKWGKPCYAFQGTNLAVMFPLKETCGFLLCKGALLKDPKRILVRPSENTQATRQVRFTSLREIIAMETTLKAYLREAIAAEKAGLEVKYKTITEYPIPEELQKKLEEFPDLKKAYFALTPGRQRGYLLHFCSAKQAKTRESRVEKCLPQILQGKGLLDG